jgi:GxxExxY protein
MNDRTLLYSDVTQKIIGCAMKVHSWFGSGFSEIIYKRGLLVELEKSGLIFKAEMEKDIYYESVFLGKKRLDVIIEDKVLVELKAVSELEKAHYNQTINYLKVFDLEIGLLLNFGSDSLQFKRLINSRKNRNNPLNEKYPG